MGMAIAVLVGALLVLTLGVPAPLSWVVGPATAEADGVKIIIGGGPRPLPGVHHPHRFHHQPTPHAHDAHLPGHHFKHNRGHPPSPHEHVIIVPRTIVIVPSPPPQRWVPGHWSYQWVPQSPTSEVWVPGRWSQEGVWIGGHYELRTISTGYYRPVWVEGYWVPHP